jgi:hypothetical protein
MGDRAGVSSLRRRDEQEAAFHVTVSFNAEGVGPRPMMVVPNLRTAGQVFMTPRGRGLITSTENGWVDGRACIKRAAIFSEWLQL